MPAMSLYLSVREFQMQIKFELGNQLGGGGGGGDEVKDLHDTVLGDSRAEALWVGRCVGGWTRMCSLINFFCTLLHLGQETVCTIEDCTLCKGVHY